MNTRERVRISGELTVGLLAILFSNLFSYILFKFIIVKIPDFDISYWYAYGAILLFSHVSVTICFSWHINLEKRSRPMEVMAALRNCAITYSLVAVTLLLTKSQIIESRYLFVSSFVLYCVFSLLGRYFLKKSMIKNMPKSKLASMVGVITTVDRSEKFVSSLIEDWSKNVKAVALIDVEYKDGAFRLPNTVQIENGTTVVSTGKTIDNVAGVPVVANSDNLIGWIRTASLDEVYINVPNTTCPEFSELLEELQDMGIKVSINITSLENISENSKFKNLDCEFKADCPMAVFSPTVIPDESLIIKRIIDIIGGIVGSIISAPIILVTAIPLLLESPGPLIFKQQRIGKNGRVFNIYKLRSMYVDAEERKKELMKNNKMNGHMFKMDNDPRITKVGRVIRKLSIDELPQFWNVVKGDMSLVGTRPPTVDEFEKYESHHKRRLSLKPGITGMWQVSGRSNIQNFEEIVALDCEYIDNWSLWLDIKIMLKTVWVVLTHKGAE